jgi:hypothetical protein
MAQAQNGHALRAGGMLVVVVTLIPSIQNEKGHLQ